MAERLTESTAITYGMLIIVYGLIGLGLYGASTYVAVSMFNDKVLYEQQKQNLGTSILMVSIATIAMGVYLAYYSFINYGVTANLLFITCCFAFGVACTALLIAILSKK
jgi:hypothetical protein